MASTTISHVAARAGVSIKTVSRVLNNEQNVAESTRERVKKAVAELNYRPNLSARSLAGSRSYLLGLLFDNPSPDYVTNLLFGAIEESRKSGYHVMSDRLDSTSKSFADELEAVISNVRADGFILSPPICDNPLVLDALARANTPYVRIAPYRALNKSPSVNIDDAGAAFEMTSLLIKLGHRKIGFIKGHPDHGATHLRYGGYAAALRAKNVPLVQDYVRQGDFSPRSGVDAGGELLSLPDPPTAIFASNDAMALGVMLAANRLGLKVPADLSICGFDDMAAATLVWPQLTTVRQPIAEMSGAAAELLIARNREPVARLLDFAIVVRDSTGPVRAGKANPSAED
jgi:LacI family transcriptional regulator